MAGVQIIDHSVLVAFWLTFTRWLATLIQLPLFDGLPVPSVVKVLAALAVSYAFFPSVEAVVLVDVEAAGDGAFWLLTAFNALVGLVLGFLVKSIMAVFASAGSVVTQQMGFEAASYFDPMAERRTGPLEVMVGWTVVAMVLSSGALAPMLKGMLATFGTVRPHDLGALAGSPLHFVGLFRSVFLSAVLLASPLIFTNILMMALLGIIARVVPQMNVIMMSFVVNIGLGLFVFAVVAEEFFRVSFAMYVERLGDWFRFVT